MRPFDSFLARHGHDSTLQASQFSAFQRVLLSTDGTVTDAIQAYFDESIGVRTLAQETIELAVAMPELQVPAATRLLRRFVVLSGKTSGRSYVCARSSILTDRLPQGIGAALLEQIKPIGTILCEHRLETRREILACGLSRGEDRDAVFSQVTDPAATNLYRTYRILYRSLPVMVITEYFPEVLP